jgi:hypothetical protein
MGMDSYFICDDCRSYQYNGAGWPSRILQDARTVSEFDRLCTARAAEELAESGYNINIRAFLSRHDGHRIRTKADDWYSCDHEGLAEEEPPIGMGHRS